MPRVEEEAESWTPWNPAAETLASTQSCVTGSRHLTIWTHICGHQPESFTDSESNNNKKKKIIIKHLWLLKELICIQL